MVILVKLVPVIIALVALYFAGRTIARAVKRRQFANNLKWELSERSDGKHVLIEAVREGDQPIKLGDVPFRHEDFEGKLLEARSEAEYTLATLNTDVKPRRH